MKPLVVRYERSKPDPRLGLLVIDSLNGWTHDRFDDLEDRIESSAIDEIVLVGYGVCIGWHIYVRRQVKFIFRLQISEQDAIAQRQAQYRIWEKS